MFLTSPSPSRTRTRFRWANEVLSDLGSIADVTLPDEVATPRRLLRLINAISSDETEGIAYLRDVFSQFLNRVAYVGDRNQLMVYSLHSGDSTPLIPRILIDGVGAWSPDGRFLLAGIRRNSSSERRLAIINMETLAVFEVLDLGDPFGNTFAWIKKDFLAK